MLDKYFSINNIIKKSQIEDDKNKPINQQPPEPPVVPQAPAQQPANQQPAQPPVNQPAVQPPQPPNQLAQKPKGNRVLVYLGDKKWGPVRTSASIKLKGLTPQEYAKLTRIAEAHMRTLAVGGKYPPWILDQNKKPQAYFLFSKNKDVDEGYYVITNDQIGFSKLTKGFEDLGFDTTPLVAAAAPVQQGEEQAPQGNKPLQDPKTVEATNPDGDVVSIRFTHNQEVINFIKREKIVEHPNATKPVSSCIFSIRAGNVPSQLVDLANFMKTQDYNVEQFRLAIEQFERHFDENKVSKVDKNKIVTVEKAVSPAIDKNGNRIMQETKFLLKIIYPKTPESLNEMKNFIKFSFPSKGNNTDLDPREYKTVQDRDMGGLPNGKMRSYFAEPEPNAPAVRFPPQGMRLEVDGGKACLIYGEYDDLVRFGVLLTTRNWDVSQYRTQLAILSNGKKDDQGNVIEPPRVKKTRYTGEPDGYKKLGPNGKPLLDENGKIIPDTERFFSETVDQLARSESDPEKPIIDLFYKQKQGIFWLYQRNSAILGDDTGTGKCEKFNTTVFANGQLMTMEEIWNNYHSDSIVKENENEEWCEPSKKLIVNTFDGEKISTTYVGGLFRQRYKGNLRKIKTWNGKIISTTYEHKFLTPTGWNNNLNVGDCIIAPRFLPPQIEKYTDCEDSLAELLGWQISEGCEIKNTTFITQQDLSVLENLKDIFKKVAFENNIRTANSKKEIVKSYISLNKTKTNSLIISSKNYRLFLESKGYIFGLKSKDKQIPSYILNSKDSAVKAFLRAYFSAEAHCDTRSRRIDICSASKKLILQLSYMLGRFGIQHSFGEGLKYATNGTKIKRTYYRLYIIGSGVETFIKEIGFVYDYKNNAFLNQTTKTNPNKEGKPLNHILESFFESYDIPYRHANIPEIGYIKGTKWASDSTIDHIIIGFENILNGNSFKEYANLKKSKWTTKTLLAYKTIQQEEIEKIITNLTYLRNSNLQYERIVSVENEEYDNYVYDLTIFGKANYVAEGLVCHNTLSTLAAAAMRMKQKPGSRAIIFTPKATQNQWVAEIQKLIRNTVGKVSTNAASDADWIVMSYSNLASKPELNADGTVKINANGAPVIASGKGRKVQMVLDALATQNFEVCIFDEAHSLKREDSATARNIEVVTKNIPFKWGATATPASNSAIDVHNILKCSGHSLGKLSKEDFKEEFIGENASMKTLADKEKALLMIQKAHNLNKWLCLSGAYLKRSMTSMNPGMPPHEINEHYIEDVQFDMEAFNRGLEEKLQEYGRTRRSVLVQLMAERMTLANQKVPYTVKEAINIINQGGKVLIFSCFKNSCEALFNSMQAYLRGGLRGYEGEEHTNIAAAGYKVVQITDKSKGSKGVQQAVDGFKGIIRERNGKITEDPDSLVKVMIVSALKGGTGISLENTTEHVLINDFDWMPAVCQQVEGRAYRINNIFPVNTRYMVVKGSGVDANGKRIISPDEKFYEYVRTKMEITKAIQHIDEKMEEQLSGGKSVKEQEAELLKKQIDLVNNEANIEEYIDELGGGNLQEEKGKKKQGVGNILNDLFEEEQERKEDEDENDNRPDVRMAGVYRWYKSAFGFL